MCFCTKHLHYLLFLSNSYYNRKALGSLTSLEKQDGNGAPLYTSYIYIYILMDATYREKKQQGGKYIIYQSIIGISRQRNQGAMTDYFLPYHPKWWKRRRNYQPAADCWAGILMVIIGALMVYLLLLSFPLSGLISPVIGAN